MRSDVMYQKISSKKLLILTHWGLVLHISVIELVQVMLPVQCHAIIEPMLICQLDPQELI